MVEGWTCRRLTQAFYVWHRDRDINGHGLTVTGIRETPDGPMVFAYGSRATSTTEDTKHRGGFDSLEAAILAAEVFYG